MQTEVLIIVPYINGKEVDPDSKRVSWSFLHGDLEDDAGYDVFGIKGIDPKDLIEGKHKCEYNGRACTLFYWYVDCFKSFKGLVVYDDDESSYEYALECFDNKAEFI